MFIDRAQRAEIEMLIPADCRPSVGQYVAWLVGCTYLALIAALVVGLITGQLRDTIKRVEFPKDRTGQP